MRTLIVILTGFVTVSLFAQTPVTKSFAAGADQKLILQFDYPELIKVTTWEKNEVSISGTVNINGGENDDAFELTQSASGKTLTIEGHVKNVSQLPHRFTLTKASEKITFKTQKDLEEYKNKHGHDYIYTSQGADIDIVLEIKVPRNMETRIEATYGLVEIRDFNGPLIVESIYGGIDVAIQASNVGDLIVETGYGQIFTNLDLKFTGSQFKQFNTQVVAKPGKGPRYGFESKYGNVYLRKPL